jgi:predicted glutamine amidotransferase
LCIAIVTQKGCALTDEQLFRGWTSNPNGGGFAYIRDGEVRIDKGYMEYNPFQKAYRKAVELYANDNPMLVHMRIRTSGTTGPKNTHPFKINGGAMIHNGIMFTPAGNRVGNKDDARSDTRIFCEDLHNILDLDSVKKAATGIHAAIGRGNKLCFLYDNAETFIIGEDMGHWDKGIWYSNSSCGVSRYGVRT